MNTKTLKALRGSIRKWEKIVAGTGTDEGPGNCPLCQLFLYDKCCAGCPIAQFTGTILCSETPYIQWEDYYLDAEAKTKKATTTRAKKPAQDELDFLKSLLPKTKSKK